MNYELKVLEHIITVLLNPKRLNRESLNEAFMNECKEQVETESDRIRNQFRKMAFGGCRKSDLASYYWHHQVILVQLADVAYRYLLPEGTESIDQLTEKTFVLDAYKVISAIPEDLLNFIKKNLPEFFDHDIKLPEAKRWQLAQEIKRSLKSIEKGFRKREVNEDLIKISCSAFDRYLLPDEIISFRDLNYLLELKAALVLFNEDQKGSNVNEDLSLLLLRLNFNSIRFFDYYILQLQERAKDSHTLPDLIAYYSLNIKIVNQVAVKPHMIYESVLPAIKEQIGAWICEELYCLEKQERYLYLESRPNKAGEDKDVKIHTSLSVSHLAMAVKLLVEAKVITNKNSRDLMRLVAKNFRTDRQEVISEESLWNKSYSFESSTVNRLKDEIIGLMNLVRKY